MSATKDTMEFSKQEENDEAALVDSGDHPMRPFKFLVYLVISVFFIAGLLFVPYYFQMLRTSISVKPHPLAEVDQISSSLPHRSVPAPEIVKQNSLTDVQMQYAKAIHLLNEGQVDLAQRELKSILEKNPDFRPAKESLALTME